MQRIIAISLKHLGGLHDEWSHGYGTYTGADGSTITGKWKNNEYQP